ncbi:MAG: hypothetical protein ACI9FU_000770 [Granulosicoccus sp.]|jgi:hypothetical protein
MSSFSGPLFVVGMPRSGTKLLRNLLNNHSQISIPEHESQFIPAFLKSVQAESSPGTWLEYIKTQKFYFNYPSLQDKINTAVLKSKTPAEAIESILKITAPDSIQPNTIWGDKSPQYLVHMPVLKEYWPAAKFIHVIRDPRDLVLSNRKAWGRNIYRTAHRWNEKVAVALRDGAELSEDHMHIQYEDLLDSPQETIGELLKFLGLELEPGMLEVKSKTENYGDAKGETKVVKSNKGKFLKQLSKSALTKIEEITFTASQSIGLEYEHGKNQRVISQNDLKIYKLMDGLNLAKFHIKEKGLVAGIKYLRSLTFEDS